VNKTFVNWRAGTIPLLKFRTVALRVFFGNPLCESPLRTELESLWGASQEHSDPRRERLASLSEPSQLWGTDSATSLGEGFVSLDAEVKSLSGKPDEPGTLTVSVSLGELYDTVPAEGDRPALSATLRISKAQLLLERENVAANGPVIGRERKRKGVGYRGGSWWLDNPRGKNENPLSDDELCKLQCSGDGPHRISLTLRCRDRDIDPMLHNAPDDDDGKKRAVATRILERAGCKEPGGAHVTLAARVLRRVPSK
jgi:hypothetical protein